MSEREDAKHCLPIILSPFLQRLPVSLNNSTNRIIRCTVPREIRRKYETKRIIKISGILFMCWRSTMIRVDF